MGWPKYTTLKYYYTNKTVSEKLENRWWKHKDTSVCASIVLTGDGRVYMNQLNGSIVWNSDSEDNIVSDWISTSGIKYAIEYQPYDFEDCWCRGHALYSKDLWRLALQDIRDFKIKLIEGKIDLNKIEWIK